MTSARRLRQWWHRPMRIGWISLSTTFRRLQPCPALLLLAYAVSAAAGERVGNTPSDAELLETRPFEVRVPTGYDPAVPTPLVVILHGLGGNGARVLRYFRFAATADRHGFLVALPNGADDPFQRPHWNATDACCASGDRRQDDVRYLSLMLDRIEAGFNVDNRRIFFIGGSNGGFMSHRMACEISGRVAAIAALNGSNWKHARDCPATEAVNILQVHGDADEVILYRGGMLFDAEYPGAVDSVSSWARRNGCAGPLADSGDQLDIEASLPGRETRVQAFTDCPAGGAVELWTIEGGGHTPDLNHRWPEAIWSFLSSHAKP